MSLTAAEVAEIMRLVEQSTFDELTLEMDGVKLSLRRGAAVQTNGAALPSPWAGGQDAGRQGLVVSENSAAGAAPAARSGASAGTSATPAKPAGAIPGSLVPPADVNTHDVLSPLLGTFYRSPKPGAPPFVEVGATVEADTVIAIIEVMKLMNTVRAGVRGTVTHIFIPDGNLVEFEQPLIRVSKTG